jgi:hypothetical protein
MTQSEKYLKVQFLFAKPMKKDRAKARPVKRDVMPIRKT